jgi:uncharacterized protein YtpQ (UPF0354 family)
MSSKHAIRRALAYCSKAKAMLIPSQVDVTQSTRQQGKEDASELTPETTPVSLELPYGRVVYIVEQDTQAEHYELVQRGDIELASLSAAQLHTSALIQLTHFANQQLDLMEHKNGLWELSVGAGFEASLVLIDELWTEVMPKFVGTNPLVAIPHQDRIIVGRTEQSDVLKAEIDSAQTAGMTMQFPKILQHQPSGWNILV